MNYYQQPYNQDVERQQFNIPGLFDFFTGGGNQSGFPGVGPGGSPGFPGGGNFPGGQHGPGFPGGGQSGAPGWGQPSFPGGQGFPGGGQSASAPTTPPPSFTPEKPQFQTFAVDPGAIRGCLYRFTYIWLNRSSFWFFPIYVGRNSVAGFRWYGNRWSYFGVDLDRVQSFQCF
ncbi:hypothetical protein ACW2QC_11805 [Virgibacillus sp. FSP13]